jgi:hypothetical protein
MKIFREVAQSGDHPDAETVFQGDFVVAGQVKK